MMSFPPRTRSVAPLAALALALLAAGCAGRTETEAPRPAPLANAVTPVPSPPAPLANTVAPSPSQPAELPAEAYSEALPELSRPEPLAKSEGDAEQRPALSRKSQLAGAPPAAVAMARPRAESSIAALADHASRDNGAAGAPGADMYAFSMPPPAPAPANTERYQHLDDNPVHRAADDPVSTFSLDVDTGSYSNVRRYLAQGSRPPEDAVRVEELVNYFPYDYPPGDGSHPFGIRTELAPCPWKPEHWLMRVAVRADEVEAKEMPAANLVFLVDVSGSMQDAAKLPLLRSSLKLLVDQLRSQDRVSLVVYAGREAVVLEPTAGDQREAIRRAIDNLEAGGSTAGEAGLRLAYRMARQGYVRGGINRVLLATDGDFNVGITDFEQVKDLIERERESGVQLSTIGFGTGNYNEHLMEQLADVGNGSYAYIDNLQEGRKVLVDQVRSTLVTVAKDVKIQVEFNPSAVAEYRLIGYENRVLAHEDFNNDRIDAGDVGAGQSVTALYELTPLGAAPSVDPLRYGSDSKPALVDRALPAELAFVKLRYKDPDGAASKLVEVPVRLASLAPAFDKTGDDFRFAAAVAGFGQLLRGGKRTGSWNWDDVLATATSARGKDEFGYRSEFLSLVRMAKVGG